MSFAGEEKAVLTVSRGASHFNFHFIQYFLIHLNTKMTAKKLFFCTQAGAHICCGITVNDLITRESKVKSLSTRCFPRGYWILFTLESWCILIHGSWHVQPSNHLSRALHIYIALKSFRQVKNYIMLLAPISYFSFKFQLTEIPILATLYAPLNKTLPLWRTRVGYVGTFFHTACLFTVRRLK